MFSIFKVTKNTWVKTHFYQKKLRELIKMNTSFASDETINTLYRHIDDSFSLSRDELIILVDTNIYLISAYNYVAYGEEGFVTTLSGTLQTILRCQRALKENSLHKNSQHLMLSNY